MNTKGLKVKANIKKHFVCGGVILLCYVYLLTHEISDAEVYGFWAGLWQGGIFLPKFIIYLFYHNLKLMILCLIIHTLPTFLEIFQRKISTAQVEVLRYFYGKQKYYV